MSEPELIVGAYGATPTYWDVSSHPVTVMKSRRMWKRRSAFCNWAWVGLAPERLRMASFTSASLPKRWPGRLARYARIVSAFAVPPIGSGMLIPRTRK